MERSLIGRARLQLLQAEKLAVSDCAPGQGYLRAEA